MLVMLVELNVYIVDCFMWYFIPIIVVVMYMLWLLFLLLRGYGYAMSMGMGSIHDTSSMVILLVATRVWISMVSRISNWVWVWATSNSGLVDMSMDMDQLNPPKPTPLLWQHLHQSTNHIFMRGDGRLNNAQSNKSIYHFLPLILSSPLYFSSHSSLFFKIGGLRIPRL